MYHQLEGTVLRNLEKVTFALSLIEMAFDTQRAGRKSPRHTGLYICELMGHKWLPEEGSGGRSRRYLKGAGRKGGCGLDADICGVGVGGQRPQDGPQRKAWA